MANQTPIIIGSIAGALVLIIIAVVILWSKRKTRHDKEFERGKQYGTRKERSTEFESRSAEILKYDPNKTRESIENLRIPSFVAGKASLSTVEPKPSKTRSSIDELKIPSILASSVATKNPFLDSAQASATVRGADTYKEAIWQPTPESAAPLTSQQVYDAFEE